MNAYVAKKPGLVENALNLLVTAEHEVKAVTDLAPGIRAITFAAPELIGRKWTPGHMVQLTFGGWQHRAYTPHTFDTERGSFTIIAVLHGQGVASQWFATLKGGERIRIGSTRPGINLTAMERPLVFFGDETSLSTAAALRATRRGLHGVKLVFEGDDVEASRQALHTLGLEASVFRRDDGFNIDAAVLSACRGARDLVLTGKSQSIQRIYKAVKTASLGLRKTTNVAYWSPGKKGLSGIQK